MYIPAKNTLYISLWPLLISITISLGAQAQPNRNQPANSYLKLPSTKPNATGRGPTRRFFGMHFDFHANASDAQIGQNLSEQSLDSLLTAIKPDFIQIDCKGHPGVASYPSRVANATTAPDFAKDPLAFYRAVTRKHGVDLYVHYSGVFDVAVLEKHPNWGVVKADGSMDKANTSVYGPYADSLLIPQLKEVANYGVDGVWVDGDCWATIPDYSPAALARFQAETGIQPGPGHNWPRSDKDPNYDAFKNAARQAFIRYVGHYTDELHKHNPAFRVASNWAYSSMMPEPITTNVDYLSGDLTPGNSVNTAAMEGRILAAQGQRYHKPWDLMSWTFWYQFGPTMSGDQKTAVHMQQEAAQVIALGGGFQGYVRQKHDASIPLNELLVMAELSQFVRARQPFCQDITPIPQIAVLYSDATVKKFDHKLFSRDQAYRMQGVLTALLDAQFPVEVLSEHHLTGRLSQYPLIVVSQQDSLAPAFRQELLDYARQGGNLLLIGVATTKSFADELGIEPIGQATASTRWVHYNGATMVLNGLFQPVQTTAGVASFGQINAHEYGGVIPGVAASTIPFGKGKLMGVYADLSQSYIQHQSSKARDFIATLAHTLLPNPVVTVTGSHLVHVIANRLDNQLAINLINTGGRHADPQVFTYDEVPPLSNLTLTIHTKKKPGRIVQQPENKPLPFTYKAGVATVTVPKLMIHSVLIVE
jgi:hypothetical protein